MTPTAEEVFDGVVSRTLPKPLWTHHAHLKFATVLLCQHGLEQAENLAPNYIKQYNVSVGGENTDTDGYHHTITLFYLRHVDAWLRNKFGDYAEHQNRNELAEQVIASPLADKFYPAQYYSKDYLFSVEARHTYVEPDLK